MVVPLILLACVLVAAQPEVDDAVMARSLDRLAALNARATAVPEDQRAWRGIRDATAEMTAMPEWFRSSSRPMFAPVSAETLAMIERGELGRAVEPGTMEALAAWVFENRDRVAALHSATRADGFGLAMSTRQEWIPWFADNPDQLDPPTEVDALYLVLIPGLGKIRDACVLLSGDVIVSASEDMDDDGGEPRLGADGGWMLPSWKPRAEVDRILADDPASIDGDWVLFPPWHTNRVVRDGDNPKRSNTNADDDSFDREGGV